MRVLKEVGIRRMARFAGAMILQVMLDLSLFPPLRSLVLKLWGARIGEDTVILKIRLMNADRGGAKCLSVGKGCFVGEDVLLDLAAPVVLEDEVTLSCRTTVLTHMNVGYATHPLQTFFPAMTAETRFKKGSFVGACSVVLAGSILGEGSFVAAGSVIKGEVPSWTLVGGVPARPIRRIVSPPPASSL
jgi:maltose O-acetyltransferase